MSKKNAVKTAGRLYPLLAALFFVITSCDQDPFFIPVKSIIDVPRTGKTGTPLPLTGTVSPAFASNNAIVWIIGNDENTIKTGASISGNILNTESDGTVSITARIVNGAAEGKDYTQNFSIVFTEEGSPPEITYTVTFFTDDDIFFASQSVGEGRKAQKPNDPVKQGWDFIDWYKDLTGSPYNFDTPITGNISLYAKWTQAVPEADAVARIGSINYKTLAEAVNNANIGSLTNPTVITILKNITAPENEMSGGYTIPANKHIKLTVATEQDRAITASNGNFDLFTIDSGSSLTLEGNGAGKLILNGGGADSTGENRRGVYVYGGTFMMNNNAIITGFYSSASTTSGGGVHVSNGTFNMNGGEIKDNSTSGSSGGGVYVGINGTFTMSGGTIIENKAINGGGVYNSGNFTMSGNVKIESNTANSDGGGIYNSKTFTMSGGVKIENNTASKDGGGVYNVENFTMNGGVIAGNKATSNTSKGGGVYIGTGISYLSQFTMSGGTIYGTDASTGYQNTANSTEQNKGAAIFVSGSAKAEYGGAYKEKGYGGVNNIISTTDKTLPLPTFNSIVELGNYLNPQPPNTDITPYTIVLNVSDAYDLIGIAKMINDAGKYVILDLSGSTIQSIPEMAFSYIYDDEFCGCDTLAGIILPDTVTSIEWNAFRDCAGLTRVDIPNGVTSIGNYSFYNCNNITSVTIPNSVKSIGDSAFQYCQGLTNVYIPDSVTSIKDGAFRYCTLLTAINVDNNNDVYTSENGVLYNKNKTVLIQYPAGKTDNSFTIPNNVTNIGNYAFECTLFASINIPDSVESIGTWAFGYNDKLTSVTIPNNVTEIGGSAFQSCFGLISVTIGNRVTSIEGFAFSGCTALTSVIIPNSVQSIGLSAFQSCTSLATVTFEGTIPSSGFYDDEPSSIYKYPVFPGDLREKFYEIDNTNGTFGTYTRPNSSSIEWTKQP
jgi:uncharacterized repeat protein (TIGR02543 family)